MKEKLTLRNVILWGVALTLLVLFFISFAATVKMSTAIEGMPITITLHHALWGSDSMSAFSEGKLEAEAIPAAARAGSISGIIGVILFLLASGGLVAVSFLVKDEKLKKILVLVCAGLILVGSILLFFVGNVFYRAIAKWWNVVEGAPVTPELVKVQYPGTPTSGYGIAAGIIGILLSGGVVVSQLVIKDKKFVK